MFRTYYNTFIKVRTKYGKVVFNFGCTVESALKMVKTPISSSEAIP
jgi:hypothetical protein